MRTLSAHEASRRHRDTRPHHGGSTIGCGSTIGKSRLPGGRESFAGRPPRGLVSRRSRTMVAFRSALPLVGRHWWRQRDARTPVDDRKVLVAGRCLVSCAPGRDRSGVYGARADFQGTCCAIAAHCRPRRGVGEKPSFPTINRKGGLCGTRVSPFYTFSTGVEDAVENRGVLPAKRQASWSGTQPDWPGHKRKSMDFPGFLAWSLCGKWPHSWIEWPHRFDTRGSRSSRKVLFADPRTHRAFRPPGWTGSSAPGRRRCRLSWRVAEVEKPLC